MNEIPVDVKYNELGHIVSFVVPELGDDLAHYGVLGMRWGRRKDRGGVDQAPRSRKMKFGESEDRTEVNILRKKPIPALSNRELKTLNERLQLEKTYSELSRNTSTTKRGSKIVKEIISTGKTANEVYNLANSPIVREARKAFNNR